MKYTRSKDGAYRVNLHATMRVTREEVAAIRKVAKRAGHESLKDFLHWCLKQGYWAELDSQDNEDADNERCAENTA